MKTKTSFVSVLVLGVALSVSACAGLQKLVVVETEHSDVVEMKVSDYRFEPNNLQTYQGDTIDFRLRNVSARDHNFTLIDLDGKILQDVDILPGKTADVRVLFLRAGAYRFHSNRDLDSAMGMKGLVVVAPSFWNSGLRQGTAAVPAELSTIESRARGVFRAAEENAWPLVFSGVDVIVRNWDYYEVRTPVDSPQRDLVYAMGEAVGLLAEKSATLERDREGTMRAANDVSWAVLDLIDFYHPAVPTDIGRLDVLERRIIVDLDLFSPNFIAAENSMGRLKTIWKILRPSVVARGGIETAVQFDAALAVQEKALLDKSARVAKREVSRGLEVVNELGETLRKTP